MSGDDIPYQLRPNKFIDRQMFLDLMSRIISGRGPENYVYVSMGGRHLVDHHAIYNALGIQALYSFDKNPNDVERAKFNKPTGKTICVEMASADLPSKLDDISTEFPRRTNFVVWLDYTDGNRRTQFQEAIQTLVKLNHGDVFRITLNADYRTLNKDDEWKKNGANSPAEYRCEKLRAQLDEYMPANVTEISETNFPAVLASCLKIAAAKAERQQKTLLFKPVLITSYRDGARMLTMTCAVIERDSNDRFPSQQFWRWSFACRHWTDIAMISAPVLSSREQNRLDAMMGRSPRRMLSSLKFLPAKNEDLSLEALQSYKRFHRYYPTFRPVDD